MSRKYWFYCICGFITIIISATLFIVHPRSVFKEISETDTSPNLKVYKDKIVYLDMDKTLWLFSGTPEKISSNVENFESSDLLFYVKFDHSLWVYNSFVKKKLMDNVKKVFANGRKAFVIDQDNNLWNCDEKNKELIMSQIDSVSFANRNNYALSTEHELFVWGINEENPKKIMENVLSIQHEATGHYIVKTDGTLWSLNKDGLKQILDNVQTFKAIRTAFYVIKNDNSLWAWGKNDKGQLGDGTYMSTDSPVKIMQNVKEITGTRTLYTICLDGTLWSWGNNRHGSIGDGTKTSKNKPVKIMENIKNVYVTNEMLATFGLTQDGQLFVWGENNGIVGTGTKGDILKPIKILERISQFWNDGYYETFFAMNKDGKLLSWGEGANYENGLGYLVHRINKPTQIDFNQSILMPIFLFGDLKVSINKEYSLSYFDKVFISKERKTIRYNWKSLKYGPEIWLKDINNDGEKELLFKSMIDRPAKYSWWFKLHVLNLKTMKEYSIEDPIKYMQRNVNMEIKNEYLELNEKRYKLRNQFIKCYVAAIEEVPAYYFYVKNGKMTCKLDFTSVPEVYHGNEDLNIKVKLNYKLTSSGFRVKNIAYCRVN